MLKSAKYPKNPELQKFFKETPPADRRKVADLCGTTDLYLHQCMSGIRRLSPTLARKLAAAEPRLSLRGLRPDIWGPLVAPIAEPV